MAGESTIPPFGLTPPEFLNTESAAAAIPEVMLPRTAASILSVSYNR
jgi:hypothetical protein